MAATSQIMAAKTMSGLSEASRCNDLCNDLCADKNWGNTRYSKTKIRLPTLRMMRISRGIANRLFLGAGSGSDIWLL
jgi:hypothetical protein